MCYTIFIYGNGREGKGCGGGLKKYAKTQNCLIHTQTHTHERTHATHRVCVCERSLNSLRAKNNC